MICDITIVWQDIEVKTPRSGEMVRYGLNYERGDSDFVKLQCKCGDLLPLVYHD